MFLDEYQLIKRTLNRILIAIAFDLVVTAFLFVAVVFS